MLEVKMGVPVPPSSKIKGKSELRKELEAMPVGGMAEVSMDKWPNGLKASMHTLIVTMNIAHRRKTGENGFVSRSLPNGNVGVWRVA